jgi:predicted phage terminase large subunit-like protein
MEFKCLHCTELQPMEAFSVFSRDPLQLHDFCVRCETQHGFKELYERHAKMCTRTILAAFNAEKRQLDQTNLLRQEVEAGVLDEHKELARRELVRRRLIAFTQTFHPAYSAGWVHNDIARRLERFMHQIERQESPRLMLCMPPRHGKSILASKMFPAWMIGHHPEWEIIGAAHSAGLVEGFSRGIRDLINTPEYGVLFGKTVLRTDSQSVQTWSTTGGGGYVAAGVGTGITGKGAHALVIDDPVKDAEAADSDQIRQNTFDWYMTTARSRLAPGGGVLVIMTRWHDMDLAGRLLALEKELREAGFPEDEIEKWELINYPAIADHNEYLLKTGEIVIGDEPKVEHRELRKKGEALHPARYGLKALNMIRSGYMRTNPRHWHALYQQKPAPDDGAFFRRDTFRYQPFNPQDLASMRIIAAWDPAVGEKQTNDWTVGIVFGIDYSDNIHILEMIRDRMDSLAIVEAMISVQKRYKPISQGIEHGVISLAVLPVLRQQMQKRSMAGERDVYINLDETLKPINDKQVRAKPLQGAFGLRRIIFPSDQPWVEKMEHELLRFPNGEHDDIVDALAWGVRMLGSIPAPQRPVVQKAKSWRDDLHLLTGDSKSWMAS